MNVVKGLVATIALLGAGPTFAATLLVNGEGKLTGATGVIVGNGIYDVSFREGTCQQVYGTCVQSSFDFDTLDEVKLAGQALLNQVLIDTEKGSFDTTAGTTLNCTNASQCASYIAYGIFQSNTDFLAGVYAQNFYPANSSVSDVVSVSQLNKNLNTATNITINYARFNFTGVAAAVPEASTWSMLIVGFGMIGATARYRRRATKVVYA